jgi:hypothetical protein
MSWRPAGRAAKGSGGHGCAARRAVLCLAALAAAAGGAASCGDRRGAWELFDLVPASSVVVAGVDWRAVSGDAGLRRVMPAANVEELFSSLGVDPNEVDGFVLFGDGRDARSGSTGVIVRGQFDADSVVEGLKGRGWREQADGEQTLYVGPSGEEYCATLGDLLVAGSRAGVVAALRRGDGGGMASSPSYEKLAARLGDSDAPVLIVVAAPQRVQDMTDAGLAISAAALEFAQMDFVAGVVRQLGAVRGVGCALAHDEAAGGFPVELVAVMRDEETAGIVSGTLNLAQGLSSALPQDANAPPAQRQMVENFQRMEIDRDADVLSIKVVMTEAQLRGR